MKKSFFERAFGRNGAKELVATHPPSSTPEASQPQSFANITTTSSSSNVRNDGLVPAAAGARCVKSSSHPRLASNGDDDDNGGGGRGAVGGGSESCLPSCVASLPTLSPLTLPSSSSSSAFPLVASRRRRPAPRNTALWSSPEYLATSSPLREQQRKDTTAARSEASPIISKSTTSSFHATDKGFSAAAAASTERQSVMRADGAVHVTESENTLPVAPLQDFGDAETCSRNHHDATCPSSPSPLHSSSPMMKKRSFGLVVDASRANSGSPSASFHPDVSSGPPKKVLDGSPFTRRKEFLRETDHRAAQAQMEEGRKNKSTEEGDAAAVERTKTVVGERRRRDHLFSSVAAAAPPDDVAASSSSWIIKCPYASAIPKHPSSRHRGGETGGDTVDGVVAGKGDDEEEEDFFYYWIPSPSPTRPPPDDDDERGEHTCNQLAHDDQSRRRFGSQYKGLRVQQRGAGGGGDDDGGVESSVCGTRTSNRSSRLSMTISLLLDVLDEDRDGYLSPADVTFSLAGLLQYIGVDRISDAALARGTSLSDAASLQGRPPPTSFSMKQEGGGQNHLRCAHHGRRRGATLTTPPPQTLLADVCEKLASEGATQKRCGGDFKADCRNPSAPATSSMSVDACREKQQRFEGQQHDHHHPFDNPSLKRLVHRLMALSCRTSAAENDEEEPPAGPSTRRKKSAVSAGLSVNDLLNPSRRVPSMAIACAFARAFVALVPLPSDSAATLDPGKNNGYRVPKSEAASWLIRFIEAAAARRDQGHGQLYRTNEEMAHSSTLHRQRHQQRGTESVPQQITSSARESVSPPVSNEIVGRGGSESSAAGDNDDEDSASPSPPSYRAHRHPEQPASSVSGWDVLPLVVELFSTWLWMGDGEEQQAVASLDRHTNDGMKQEDCCRFASSHHPAASLNVMALHRYIELKHVWCLRNEPLVQVPYMNEASSPAAAVAVASPQRQHRSHSHVTTRMEQAFSASHALSCPQLCAWISSDGIFDASLLEKVAGWFLRREARALEHVRGRFQRMEIANMVRDHVVADKQQGHHDDDPWWCRLAAAKSEYMRRLADKALRSRRPQWGHICGGPLSRFLILELQDRNDARWAVIMSVLRVMSIAVGSSLIVALGELGLFQLFLLQHQASVAQQQQNVLLGNFSDSSPSSSSSSLQSPSLLESNALIWRLVYDVLLFIQAHLVTWFTLSKSVSEGVNDSETNVTLTAASWINSSSVAYNNNTMNTSAPPSSTSSASVMATWRALAEDGAASAQYWICLVVLCALVAVIELVLVFFSDLRATFHIAAACGLRLDDDEEMASLRLRSGGSSVADHRIRQESPPRRVNHYYDNYQSPPVDDGGDANVGSNILASSPGGAHNGVSSSFTSHISERISDLKAKFLRSVVLQSALDIGHGDESIYGIVVNTARPSAFLRFLQWAFRVSRSSVVMGAWKALLKGLVSKLLLPFALLPVAAAWAAWRCAVCLLAAEKEAKCLVTVESLSLEFAEAFATAVQAPGGANGPTTHLLLRSLWLRVCVTYMAQSKGREMPAVHALAASMVNILGPMTPLHEAKFKAAKGASSSSSSSARVNQAKMKSAVHAMMLSSRLRSTQRMNHTTAEMSSHRNENPTPGAAATQSQRQEQHREQPKSEISPECLCLHGSGGKAPTAALFLPTLGMEKSDFEEERYPSFDHLVSLIEPFALRFGAAQRCGPLPARDARLLAIGGHVHPDAVTRHVFGGVHRHAVAESMITLALLCIAVGGHGLSSHPPSLDYLVKLALVLTDGRLAAPFAAPIVTDERVKRALDTVTRWMLSAPKPCHVVRFATDDEGTSVSSETMYPRHPDYHHHDRQNKNGGTTANTTAKTMDVKSTTPTQLMPPNNNNAHGGTPLRGLTLSPRTSMEAPTATQGDSSLESRCPSTAAHVRRHPNHAVRQRLAGYCWRFDEGVSNPVAKGEPPSMSGVISLARELLDLLSQLHFPSLLERGAASGSG